MNLDAPTRARLPASALPSLADLRARTDLDVLLGDEHLWLRWRSDPEAMVLRLLPLPEAELFEQREGQWYPAGRLLPFVGVPEDRQRGWKPLASVLFPARIEPLREAVAEWDTVLLRLVPSEEPHAATALRADFDVVLAWGDAALNSEIQAQRAVWTRTEFLLFGSSLPALTPSRRFHGERILLPLGYAVSPALPLTGLVEMLGLQANEIALIDEPGVEIIEENRIRSLTRASLRRAAVLRLED